MAEKQRAYDEYMAAETLADKIGLHHTSVISQEFVDYIEQYEAVDPHSVSTAHLQTRQYSKQVFFQTAMSLTFHLHSAQYTPSAVGPSNGFIVEFRFNGDDTYTIRSIGFNGVEERDIIDPSYWIVSSNSIVLQDGLVGVNLKRLNGTMVGAQNVWVYEITVNGRLTRHYLLPIVFRN